jgi:diguanylate cyclase (GGDEF)-like protein
VSQVRAPSSDEAVSGALPGLSYGLALLAGAQGCLLFVLGGAGASRIGAGELVASGGCALTGWLAGTGRLPAWRREAALTLMLLVLTTLSAVRTAVLSQVWQVADLAVLVIAAAAVSNRARVLGAIIGGAALSWTTAALFVSLSQSPTREQVASWAGLALVMLAGAAVANGIRRTRRGWAAALATARLAATEHAVRDPLTGTANRRGLEMVARPMIEHARRDGQAVHCLMVDVDGLRAVNDALGTRGGDDVLVAVVEALRASIRSTDVLSRWGEDAFVVIGPGTGMSPLEMERRVRAAVKETPPVPEQVWAGRVSAGSSTLVPWDEGDLDSLLRRSEQDMSLRRSLRRRASAVEGSHTGVSMPP